MRKTEDIAANSTRLVATTHRESREADSESLAERWKMDRYTFINESVIDGNSSTPFLQRIFSTKKFSEFEIATGSCRSWQNRTSDWNWNVQICKNFDALRIQVPSQQAGNTKVLGAKSTRKWKNKTHDNCNSYRDWPLKSWSRITTTINTLRATASTRNKCSFVSQFSRCARNKDCINWFQSASLEIDPCWSANQKKISNSHTTPRKMKHYQHSLTDELTANKSLQNAMWKVGRFEICVANLRSRDDIWRQKSMIIADEINGPMTSRAENQVNSVQSVKSRWRHTSNKSSEQKKSKKEQAKESAKKQLPREETASVGSQKDNVHVEKHSQSSMTRTRKAKRKADAGHLLRRVPRTETR